MKKKILCLMLSLFIVIFLSFSIVGVLSKKPIHVVGNGAGPPDMTITPVKFAGGNTFYSVTGTGSYIGPDIIGTTAGVHRWHENKDGKINLHLDLVFTGTILGKSGSVLMRCNGIAGSTARWSIISGTGELANLRGTGIVMPGLIEGDVHFEP